jgi:hypothetical protein
MKSLVNTKAPVVAVPVEGKAPVCVDGKRLRTWSKGVTIERVEVIVTGGEWYPTEKPLDYGVCGPRELIAERTVETRRLRLVGHVGRIKTSCMMNAINRHEALITLRNWSERL